MHRQTHWMGTPRTAGFVAGGWCWAAATLALDRTSPQGTGGVELLRWLAADGNGPALAPVMIAVVVVLVHATVIRQAETGCCREWIDAAWSLGLIACGIAAWSWAVHYEPFTDPFSMPRRLAAVTGLGGIIFGTTLTLTTATAVGPGREPSRVPRLRRSYESIG